MLNRQSMRCQSRVVAIFRMLAILAFLPMCIAAEGTDASLSDEQRTFVTDKVIPLFQARCFQCHDGREEPKGSLLLTSRDAILQGGDSGPAVVPGKPDESMLIEAIRYEGLEMPPRSRMPDAEIQILVDWVQMGSPWPNDLKVGHAEHIQEKIFPLQERRETHWAWHPIQTPETPVNSNQQWADDPLDDFILARLEEAGLQPAADADRTTLIRRLYFDLIGLPPSPQQIQSFHDDPATDHDALSTVVDELLRSPQFGERWGRHWLDLVRYAETLGHEFDYPLRHAWQYRDYVIRAFNADVPYDDLIREHVAGDLLSEPRRHPTDGYNESVIGTGFWFLHEDKHAPVDVEYEEAVKVDNQIDVFSRTFLGLTVACARCHDHKFDAITTKDYYSLYGVLQSSRRQTAWLDPDQKIAATTSRLKAIQSRADRLLADVQVEELTTGLIGRYVQATRQVISGTPKAGEGPDKAFSGTTRSIQAVADELDCDSRLLTEWVKRLVATDTSELSDRLATLVQIVQSPAATEPDMGLAAWALSVQQATDAIQDSPLFADFSEGLPEGWSYTGPAFHSDKRSPVSVGGGRYPLATTGFSSADLSPKFRGSIYSPTFELTHPDILIRIAGEKARARLVIDGYVMMEFNALLFNGIDQKVNTKGEFQWIRLGGDAHRYIGRHAYIEIMDQSNGWFVVDEIRFVEQQNGPPPANHIAKHNQQLAKKLVAGSSGDSALRSVASALWPVLFAEGLLPSATHPEWVTLKEEWAAEEKSATEPVAVLATTDGTGEDQHVFIRGNHRNLGEIANRSFLEAIAGAQQPAIESGSGRRELVERMLHQDNPLPARVAVNRVWHHLFGRGIVASTDDFGFLGARPTHPKLLDHLADEFRKDGWSIKRLIRRLILSRTWRMSSLQDRVAAEKDPTNALLHSARVRRLQGEVIRDTMLKLAGKLDLQQFGRSVPVALTSFMQGRGRPKKSGPLDGNGRRSIYISVNRNFLSPFMLAFDTPAPMSTRGRRTVSNVPAQALILLNDEFAHQQAGRWADRLLQTEQPVGSTLSDAWLHALGRLPTGSELATITDFARSQAQVHQESLSEDSIGKATLQDVCHAIMNTKEFIYIR